LRPVDKFGRPIFPHIYKILLYFGEMLSRSGWIESKPNPNLFYKEFKGLVVYADMRGTQQCPIWQNPVPLIYVQESKEAWKRRRAIRVAIDEMGENGVSSRISFYESFSTAGLYAMRTDGKIFFPDGSCHFCHAEFENDGLFCGDECRMIYEQLEELRKEEDVHVERCFLCSRALDPWGHNRASGPVEHHITYDPPKTITLCRSCHRKIHVRHEKYPLLTQQKKPVKIDSREEQEDQEKEALPNDRQGIPDVCHFCNHSIPYLGQPWTFLKGKRVHVRCMLRN
jgi:hypothetical protein